MDNISQKEKKKQISGIDYYNITLPVSHFDSLQMLLSIGMIDVKGAYLHATLEEDIYIK